MTVRPLSSYCLRRDDLRGLVIGYGYAPLEKIERFGPVLGRAIAAELTTRRATTGTTSRAPGPVS